MYKNHEFVPSVNFEFLGLLTSNGTKYTIVFDDSSEEVLYSKALFDIATARRHRRALSTNYTMQNFLTRSKIGQDVQLQNTHHVGFKSPRAKT